MKNLALGIVAAIGLSTAAQAADMAVKARPAPVAAVVYNWSGFYVGGHAGGGWQQFDGQYVLPPLTDHHSSSDSRFLGGGFVGGQWQFQNWVIGAEASGTWIENSWSSSLSQSNACLLSTANRTCTHNYQDLFDIGGKVGVAFDRWMVYGIGGYASVQLNTQTLVTNTNVITSQSGYRHDGWFVGVGGDVIVAKWGSTDLVAGLQYKHYEFDTVRHFAAAPGLPAPVVPDGNTRDMSGKLDVVTARLSIKFGAPAAVVAKY